MTLKYRNSAILLTFVEAAVWHILFVAIVLQLTAMDQRKKITKNKIIQVHNKISDSEYGKPEIWNNSLKVPPTPNDLRLCLIST